MLLSPGSFIRIPFFYLIIRLISQNHLYIEVEVLDITDAYGIEEEIWDLSMKTDRG